jgi:outer membrane protein OmpA-like peptidoglycan-associated protein
MKRTKNRVRRVLILLAVLFPILIHAEARTSSSNPCVGETFYHASMGKQEVFSDFEGSVFRIWTLKDQESEPRTLGTAFLIDSQRGYVLTAFHVVEPAVTSPGVTIYASSSRLPSKTFTLKMINHLSNPEDVAILELTDASDIKAVHLQALDIAFHFLPKGSRYFTIGYPRGKKTPNDQEAELQGFDDNRHVLDVKQDVDEGTSGSPLVDENGAVVGIATDMLNKSEALYTPLVDLEELFEKLHYDSAIKDLDEKVLGKPEEGVRLALIQQLKWISGGTTNVELYEYARHIHQNRARYESSRFYFICPILEAYSDRRLGDSQFVQEIASLFSPQIQAKMLLDSADQNMFLGRPRIAEQLARGSLELYDKLNDQSGRAAASQSFAVASVETHDYPQAADLLEKAVAMNPHNAEANFYLGKAYLGQGQWEKASAQLQSALNEFQAANDKASEGAVYTTFAELSAHQGNFPEAMQYVRKGAETCQTANDWNCVLAAKRQQVILEASSPKPLVNGSQKEVVQEAKDRLTTVEGVVSNIDQYKPTDQTEIRFRPGQTVLTQNAKTALDEIAAPLKGQRGYILEVQGLSSGKGQAAIATSRKMADAVVQYLVLNHDIPIYRIYVVGMGNAPAPTTADSGEKRKTTTGGRVEVSLLKNDLEQTATPEQNFRPDKKD